MNYIYYTDSVLNYVCMYVKDRKKFDQIQENNPKLASLARLILQDDQKVRTIVFTWGDNVVDALYLYTSLYQDATLMFTKERNFPFWKRFLLKTRRNIFLYPLRLLNRQTIKEIDEHINKIKKLRTELVKAYWNFNVIQKMAKPESDSFEIIIGDWSTIPFILKECDINLEDQDQFKEDQ